MHCWKLWNRLVWNVLYRLVHVFPSRGLMACRGMVFGFSFNIFNIYQVNSLLFIMHLTIKPVINYKIKIITKNGESISQQKCDDILFCFAFLYCNMSKYSLNHHKNIMKKTINFLFYNYCKIQTKYIFVAIIIMSYILLHLSRHRKCRYICQ